MRDGTLTPTPEMPTHIVVGGRPYDVTLHEALPDNLCGRIDSQKLHIQMDAKQHDYSLRDTLLHEVIHAIDGVAQIGLEEKQVYALAGQLLDTLRRNPDLTDWLLS